MEDWWPLCWYNFVIVSYAWAQCQKTVFFRVSLKPGFLPLCGIDLIYWLFEQRRIPVVSLFMHPGEDLGLYEKRSTDLGLVVGSHEYSTLLVKCVSNWHSCTKICYTYRLWSMPQMLKITFSAFVNATLLSLENLSGLLGLMTRLRGVLNEVQM